MQGNRNPFIDRPEFADLMYQAAGVDDGDAPGASAIALSQSAPNPAARSATIRFALPAAADVRLSVYDAAGRLVRVLAEGLFAPGEHEVSWDGRDAAGRPVASGVYFLRLTGPGVAASRKLTLLK
jgi:hypothetical protein